MSDSLPLWTEWLRVLSLPAIALLGAIIAALQYRLARLKRADELFRLRYEAFEDALKLAERGPIPGAANLSKDDWNHFNLSNRVVILFGHRFRNRLFKAITSRDPPKPLALRLYPSNWSSLSHRERRIVLVTALFRDAMR